MKNRACHRDTIMKPSRTIQQPLVSILILNWNRHDDLREAILSARKQTYENLQIVVVDNGSVDRSAEMVEESFPGVKLIRLHRNVGCPEGRNIGMINCDGEFIFTLDDDGVIQNDVIEKVVSLFGTNDRIGIVTIKTVNYYSGEARPAIHRCDSEKSGFVASFSGGASAIRKSILHKTGYYPHSYIYGGEENYLVYSVFNAGYLIYYLHDAVMFHKLTPKTRAEINKVKLLFRNELITTWRYFPLLLALAVTVRKYYLYFMLALRERQLGTYLKVLISSPFIIMTTRLRERVAMDDVSIMMVQRIKNRVIEDLDSLELEVAAIRRDPSYWKWLLNPRTAA